MKITNAAELTKRIEKLRKAQKIFATFSQEKVDKIFKAAAIAANNARISLAKIAVEESGMGIVEDKVIKNHFAAEYIYNQYKDMKTCGIIEEDKTFAPLFKYLGLNNDDKSKSNQTKNQICEQIINNLDSDLEKRLYSLSANLADIFDKYQVYRMNWIEEWDLEKPNSYENWIKEKK